MIHPTLYNLGNHFFLLCSPKKTHAIPKMKQQGSRADQATADVQSQVKNALTSKSKLKSEKKIDHKAEKSPPCRQPPVRCRQVPFKGHLWLQRAPARRFLNFWEFVDFVVHFAWGYPKVPVFFWKASGEMHPNSSKNVSPRQNLLAGAFGARGGPWEAPGGT